MPNTSDEHSETVARFEPMIDREPQSGEHFPVPHVDALAESKSYDQG